MDQSLLPILRLSPRLVSLSFQEKEWLTDSATTMVSLTPKMTETIRVGDVFRHTLVPHLQHLEIVLPNVDFEPVNYLDDVFVAMVVSRRNFPGPQMLKSLQIIVEGRDFGAFSSGGGPEELKHLAEGALDLNPELDDWDVRVLQARELGFHPDHH
ncbi:hypothetical protein IW262DRAFT_889323 [Armillaria fumosa]|nr:hypothetical protein IW262DRAFT_889323 [Armillaria fumosa]